MIVTEEQTLKLQLGNDGCVWYAQGIETPAVCNNLTAYLDNLGDKSNLHIRVLGLKQNAKLIVRLYQQYCSPRRGGRLEVATPTVCTTQHERQDPSISLYRMRQCILPASLGGWHAVNELDYPTYAIAAQYQVDGVFNEHIARLFETHPVRRTLQFIEGLNQQAVTQLLAEIVDPRWFVDMNNPDRISRLKNYLGLCPRYVTDVRHGRISSERAKRCQLAIQAWAGTSPCPDRGSMERPGHFLWRRYNAAGGGEKGMLRATQSFVSFFIRAWQNQLDQKSVQCDDLFMPEAILKGFEVAAFKRHIAE